MTTRIDTARRLVRKVMRDARDKNKWRKIVKFRLWMPVGLQMLLIVAVILITEWRSEGDFFTSTTLSQILILSMGLIVATMAVTHALLVGYLDLSVAGMISLGVVIASYLIGTGASVPTMLMASGFILLVGVVLGLVNAALIRGLKMPSIIATLATMSILNGIALERRPTTQGVISGDLVAPLRHSIGPVPIAFLALIAVAALMDVWLHGSSSGLQLRSVGFDERSAKRGGVSTNWMQVRALIIAGALAAVASFFVMARSGSPVGNAQVGSTFALNSITAAVLGGASLAGGRATFTGGAVAAILLSVIIVALPFNRLQPADGSMIVGILVLFGIVIFHGGDLKELVKRNYKRARRLVIGSRPPKQAEIPEFYAPGVDFAVAPSDRKLLRGGMVLSLDPAVGDFDSADVLVDGDTIVEVGPHLSNGQVEVIDASGMIVLPGFVDTHRHIWEGLLRNIGTDVPLEGRTSYITNVLHKLAPAFRPEDAYVGDLLSALGAIDAGITTLLDWSHIQGSPAHTDAVVQALNDSGMRAVFAYGFPWWGKWEERQPSWFVRCATEHFQTKDQKLTLALAPFGPEFTDFEISRDHWKLARETDARITSHVGVGSYGQDAKVQRFGEAGLLGPDTTYIHCTTLNDTEIQMIVDTGGTVSLASPVEMMMGHGMPPIQKFLDRGLAPSLSVDVETNVPGDMFNQMRSVLGLQRAMAAGSGTEPVKPRDVLSWATIEGARANGLLDKVGTLTPGKKADIVMLRTDKLNVTPLNDPVAAVVAGMDTSNVDTVLIDGRVMKAGGRLLHVDWEAVRRMADSSRDHVIAKSNFKLPKI